jgi:hypothetical protein
MLPLLVQEPFAGERDRRQTEIFAQTETEIKMNVRILGPTWAVARYKLDEQHSIVLNDESQDDGIGRVDRCVAL